MTRGYSHRINYIHRIEDSKCISQLWLLQIHLQLIICTKPSQFSRAEGVLKFNLSPLRHINLRNDGSVGEQPGGGEDPLTRGDMTATTSHHVTGAVLSPPYIRASPRPPIKDSEI